MGVLGTNLWYFNKNSDSDLDFENVEIADVNGNKSTMVKIPKMSWKDLGIGSSKEIFPAWKLSDGKELDYIYFGKYKGDETASAVKGHGYHIVKGGIDAANALCTNKGTGWHCATRLEHMAVTLWSAGHNCQPEDFDNTVADYFSADSSHNGKESGIYDLNNSVIAEWLIGVRLVQGELQVISKDGVTFGNDACNVDSTSTSPYWYAIDGTTGNLIKPNGSGTTANSIKCTSAGWGIINSANYNGTLLNVQVDSSICEKAKNMIIALGFVLPAGIVSKYNEISYFSKGDEFVCTLGIKDALRVSLTFERSSMGRIGFRPNFCAP